MKASYQKPMTYSAVNEVLINAHAQYIVNITQEHCPGWACDGDRTAEYNGTCVGEYGTSLYDGCQGDTSGPFTGEWMSFRCIETGDQVYREDIIGVTTGGSAPCAHGIPSIFNVTVAPCLPQECTITDVAWTHLNGAVTYLCDRVCDS